MYLINYLACSLYCSVKSVSTPGSISVHAVEGIDRDIYITCGLQDVMEPLYWNITGMIVDLYSVPRVFQTDRYRGLIIPVVDRRMNNCAEVTHSSRISMLTAIYFGKDAMNHI